MSIIQNKKYLPKLSTKRDKSPEPKRVKNLKEKYTALKRDNFTCHYCHCTLTMESMTLDHVVPKAHQGSNDINNLVASCKECNELKGTIPYHLFIKAINDNTLQELVEDYRQIMSIYSKFREMGNVLIKKIIFRASAIKAIGRHLEKGQINLDLLDDLDEHIEELRQIKEQYIDFICNHSPEND